MDVIIWRKYRKSDYTISRIYIDGKFFCNTLEDTDRGLSQWMSEGEIANIKIKGKTAIPIGVYKIAITYSPRFKKNMPLILNVKGFSGVRIHPGNTAEDTDGCILLGDNLEVGKVLNSRKRYNKFLEILEYAGGTADLKIVWDKED